MTKFTVDINDHQKSLLDNLKGADTNPVLFGGRCIDLPMMLSPMGRRECLIEATAFNQRYSAVFANQASLCDKQVDNVVWLFGGRV